MLDFVIATITRYATAKNMPRSAIPSFFEIKESGGVHTFSEKNLIVFF
jgi:hypothetical protein